jgi:hypothetical protein
MLGVVHPRMNTAENKVKITEAGGIKALVAAAIEAQGKFLRESAKTGVCGADPPRRARLQLR